MPRVNFESLVWMQGHFGYLVGVFSCLFSSPVEYTDASSGSRRVDDITRLSFILYAPLTPRFRLDVE
jgi:hypothetical protein